MPNCIQTLSFTAGEFARMAPRFAVTTDAARLVLTNIAAAGLAV